MQLMKMIFKTHNNAVFSSVNRNYLRAAGFALCFCVQSLYAAATVDTEELVNNLVSVKPDSLQLYAEQWELARTGESVLSLAVLNKLINSWLSDQNKSIEIQYPGGEEGEFWVQELTDWLVSMGIPFEHMIVVPGSGADDMIKFALIK